MYTRRFTVLGLLSLAMTSLGACSFDGAVGSHQDPVIYGTDDRLDYYESPSALHQRLTRESVVALVVDTDVDASDPNDVQLAGVDLATTYGICTRERFSDQPASAFCSGTLIDDDLVLTAGHCFTTRDIPGDCAATRFVFNFHYTAAGTLETIRAADDVYSCAEVFVHRNETLPSGEAYDHAIVRLDRPVTGAHAPAPIARSLTALTVGDPITMIGFPAGIPAKIDDGGSVNDTRATILDYFISSNDLYGGNSGSAMFDASGTIVGILVAGVHADWVVDRGCRISNVEPESAGAGYSSYAARSVMEYCAAGLPSTRLCGGGVDAGLPPTDAGPSGVDAGVDPLTDAGSVDPDGGVTTDAGVPPDTDAGATPDGSVAPDGGMDGGGGGCSCRVGAVGRGTPLAWIVFPLLAVWLRRRTSLT